MDYRKPFDTYSRNDKRKIFPDTWILDGNLSDANRLVFQAYDANLWPTPSFNKWGKEYRQDVCKVVQERFNDCPLEIYLDGFYFDKETGTVDFDNSIL